jgi:hypothetical protein
VGVLHTDRVSISSHILTMPLTPGPAPKDVLNIYTNGAPSNASGCFIRNGKNTYQDKHLMISVPRITSVTAFGLADCLTGVVYVGTKLSARETRESRSHPED